MITSVDKGRCIIIMDRDECDQKMVILNDESTYMKKKKKDGFPKTEADTFIRESMRFCESRKRNATVPPMTTIISAKPLSVDV